MKPLDERFVTLDADRPVWDQFFMVAPLVLVGTRHADGFNLAPKHMAMPLGWANYFGFVCTPRHATYHDAKHTGVFTVSFPRPTQLVLASLSSEPRCDRVGSKPIIESLPLVGATVVDGVFLADAYVMLECELDRVIDDFGVNSLLVGRVVAAHVDPDMLRASEVDEQQMLAENSLLVYVSPGRYSVASESIAFPFPSGFSK